MRTEQVERLKIRCPRCQGDLTLRNDEALQCESCQYRSPLRGACVDLLESEPRRRTLAQAAMEWPPLIRVYESRFWRRSPVPAKAFGITFADEYNTIANAADLKGTELLLDLACGTGIYSRPLARSLSEGIVAGVDLSAPMLREADRKARAEKIENLLFVRASAMHLPFSGQTFDVVNCCGAIHMFPSLSRALEEIRRVLRPGGCFTVATFLKPEGTRGEKITRFRRRVIGDNAYRPEDLAGHLSTAGFDSSQVHHAKGAWLIMSARNARNARQPENEDSNSCAN